MEDSWVDADHERQEVHRSPRVPRKRQGVKVTARASKSPEPELVMPSLDSDTLEASWADHTRRASKTTKRTPVRKRAMRPMTPPSPESAMEKITRRKAVPKNSGSDAFQTTLNHVVTILSHILDILGRSLKMLKWPISVAVAGLLLMALGYWLRSLFLSSLYSTVAPLCSIPGVAFLGLPFCGPTSSRYDGATAEFDQLMTVQDKFEDVLKETAVGVTLPIDMKRSEASIRDLRQLVRYSHLQSREELGFEFDHFVDTARMASNDLSRFNSHIGKAVDHVISVSRWTARVIDGQREIDGSRGSIAKFTESMLAPFSSSRLTEVALLDQYLKHTEIVEEQLHTLISEAQAILMILNNLEDRLDVINGIVTRDNNNVHANRDQILGQLWTLVGGNRGKLSKMASQLDLLQKVTSYRHTAYAHVSLTIVKLQEIAAGLEDLRERVGAPGNMRDRLDVPLDVHLENIMRGIQRLEESRNREKKIEKQNLDRTMRGPYADLEIEG